jgi:hypothetical protein
MGAARGRLAAWVSMGGCLALLNLGGCPTPTDNSNTNDNSGDNDSIRSATRIELENNAAAFTGSLASSDIDIFSIGELQTGDRLVVDVQGASGDLDPVLALLDGDERVYAFNDDREADSSDLNPRLDVDIRGPSGEYFIGLAGFPGQRTSGDYRVEVRVTPDGGQTDAPAQIIFLNWVGGQNVTVPNVGTFDLPRFSANDVGDFGDNETTTLKRQVEAIVRDRFDGFALTVVSSDASPRPIDPHSTIYFGGENRSAFAIAEQIDVQNQDRGDDAIIFSSSFKDAFAGLPTLTQISRALGNTIAHEIGHLLGLVHTRDCSELMDTTCGNSSLLAEQAFNLAPLDDSVFPLGFQDADSLLEWAIGLADSQ